MITKQKLNRAIEICRAKGVTRLILFGSAAKDLRAARDIDLGVEGVHGWDSITLAGELENELGVNVDVVDISKHSDFVSHILKHGKVLYA